MSNPSAQEIVDKMAIPMLVIDPTLPVQLRLSGLNQMLIDLSKSRVEHIEDLHRSTNTPVEKGMDDDREIINYLRAQSGTAAFTAARLLEIEEHVARLTAEYNELWGSTLPGAAAPANPGLHL